MTTICAPGKIILLGEHAVVYGRPALAVPVRQVRACAHVETLEEGEPGQLRLEAPALGFSAWLDDVPEDHPLAAVCRATLAAIGLRHPPALRLRLESTIPIASGLGSSAAVSVAVCRGLAAHLKAPLSPGQASDLAFQVERLHHGTPSGIDNTVIAYDLPVYFVKGREPEPIRIGGAFEFVVGDTGRRAPTVTSVQHVRSQWEANPAALGAVFDAIGELVEGARRALVAGHADRLGSLMRDNHRRLQTLGVSSPELDRLVDAAEAAGAYGAKLSGGGMGGNMIAAVPADRAHAVEAGLRAAGAVSVLRTEVKP